MESNTVAIFILISILIIYYFTSGCNCLSIKPIVIPPVYDKQTSKIDKIDDGVFISDFYESFNYEQLDALGIKQILTIGTYLEVERPKRFKTMFISIGDSSDENIAQYFDETYDFISSAPTLIHCYKGMSRSVSILAAYLMKKYGLKSEEAIKAVSKHRITNVNPGFRQQLKAFESSN
jgi:atypical dual specificity phosphatase